jgi:Holliday junction resolvasome RuvABC endonuclease subunit
MVVDAIENRHSYRLMDTPLKVLGVDAGFTAPGFAVVDIGQGCRVLFAECLQTEAYGGASKKKRRRLDVYKSEDDARRMVEISRRLAWIVGTYLPDLAVVELPSAGGKSSSAVKGMAIGAAVAVTTLYGLGIPQVYVSPRENKLASTGDPYAEKDAMLAAARRRYTLTWPTLKRSTKLDGPRCWAIADALGAITAWLSRWSPQLPRPATRPPRS